MTYFPPKLSWQNRDWQWDFDAQKSVFGDRQSATPKIPILNKTHFLGKSNGNFFKQDGLQLIITRVPRKTIIWRTQIAMSDRVSLV
ncbi:MAG: hypothetical protein NT075_30530, partial [Chloroflexi bacterium]|nr:hypothetical protein [Chloroflexota bacterium]